MKYLYTKKNEKKANKKEILLAINFRPSDF